VALFFYPGHGYGRNYAIYLKPVDWKTPRESVPAAMAQEAMSGAKTKIIF
jgi:hypothetical protein